ncbi:hypothetical protein [Paenibacillus sp. WLX2291]|uniref:hypothetical protein n=1 Tax=Paenibacillus sp. WLX2291 TaxID=3296934 RepID=UPI003983FC86
MDVKIIGYEQITGGLGACRLFTRFGFWKISWWLTRLEWDVGCGVLVSWVIVGHDSFDAGVWWIDY